MRILILGGDGMLGHQLLRQWRPRHEVRATLRRDLASYARFSQLFTAVNAYGAIDLSHVDNLLPVLADFVPQAVVNAAGIVKQRAAAKEYVPSIELNALLPHKLATLCRTVPARLIHVSTDCVFSGRSGNYRESDVADADDLYGRTKYLGELHQPHCLTLRSSIIGTELSRKTGLVEWFLAQNGTVTGYRNAVFSGFTTIEMARIIERLLERYPRSSGLYHVSSAPITKFDLLTKLKQRLGLSVQIVPDDTVRIDRSLDSTRFRQEFGYTPPTWDQMIDEMATDIKSGVAR